MTIKILELDGWVKENYPETEIKDYNNILNTRKKAREKEYEGHVPRHFLSGKPKTSIENFFLTKDPDFDFKNIYTINSSNHDFPIELQTDKFHLDVDENTEVKEANLTMDAVCPNDFIWQTVYEEVAKQNSVVFKRGNKIYDIDDYFSFKATNLDEIGEGVKILEKTGIEIAKILSEDVKTKLSYLSQ